MITRAAVDLGNPVTKSSQLSQVTKVRVVNTKIKEGTTNVSYKFVKYAHIYTLYAMQYNIILYIMN